jgi:hypothetical protein
LLFFDFQHMLDSELNPRFEQPEQNQKVAEDGAITAMQLAGALVSALQEAGYPVMVLYNQRDSAPQQ